MIGAGAEPLATSDYCVVEGPTPMIVNREACGRSVDADFAPHSRPGGAALGPIALYRAVRNLTQSPH